MPRKKHAGRRGEAHLPFHRPPHPLSSVSSFPIRHVRIAPSLLSSAAFHTGVENWPALIPISLSKGLGHSVDDAEAVGRGVLGKICPWSNQSGQGSSHITAHFWPGTLWAETALMVGDQNYPVSQNDFLFPVPPISVNYCINSLFWLKNAPLSV